MAVLAGSTLAGMHVADRRVAGAHSQWKIFLYRDADPEWTFGGVLTRKSVGPSVALRSLAVDWLAAVVRG